MKIIKTVLQFFDSNDSGVVTSWAVSPGHARFMDSNDRPHRAVAVQVDRTPNEDGKYTVDVLHYEAAPATDITFKAFVMDLKKDRTIIVDGEERQLQGIRHQVATLHNSLETNVLLHECGLAAQWGAHLIESRVQSSAPSEYSEADHKGCAELAMAAASIVLPDDAIQMHSGDVDVSYI